MAFEHRPIYINVAMNFGIWVNDVEPTQFDGPVNFTQLEFTPGAQEFDDLLSNVDGSVGELLASVGRPTESAQATIAFNSQPKDLLAIALNADASALSQTGATQTDQAITLVLDKWVAFPNGHRHIDTATVVVEKTGPVTIPAAEYEVDGPAGLIRALTANAATAIQVTYDTLTVTGDIMDAGKAKQTTVKLLGSATNKVTGKRGTLEIYKAILTANNNVDWAAGQYISGSAAGKLITPTGKISPYQFVQLT